MAGEKGQDAAFARASLTEALGSGVACPPGNGPTHVLEDRDARSLRLCGNGSPKSCPAAMRQFMRVFLSAVAIAVFAMRTNLVIAQGTAERPLLRGVVLDDASRAPVVGAAIQLLDETGRRLQATIADGQGRFQFTLPAPGSYKLRVDRLGYFQRESPAFPVRSEERR